MRTTPFVMGLLVALGVAGGVVAMRSTPSVASPAAESTTVSVSPTSAVVVPVAPLAATTPGSAPKVPAAPLPPVASAAAAPAAPPQARALAPSSAPVAPPALREGRARVRAASAATPPLPVVAPQVTDTVGGGLARRGSGAPVVEFRHAEGEPQVLPQRPVRRVAPGTGLRDGRPQDGEAATGRVPPAPQWYKTPSIRQPG